MCPLFATKPGTESLSVSWGLHMANRIDRKKEIGLVISNLDDLTPMEWAASEGLLLGRNRWKEVLDTRAKEKE